MDVGVQTEKPNLWKLSDETRRKIGDAKRGVKRDPKVVQRIVETKRRLRELYLVGKPIVEIANTPDEQKMAKRREYYQNWYTRMIEREKANMLEQWKATSKAYDTQATRNEIVQLNS
jgi:hypothetical protein